MDPMKSVSQCKSGYRLRILTKLTIFIEPCLDKVVWTNTESRDSEILNVRELTQAERISAVEGGAKAI